MKSQLLVAIFGITILVQGCAHKTVEKKLDAKMSEETSVKSPADINTEATQLISTANHLSPEQKAKLLSLRDSMRAQSESLMSQSLKLRSILVKDLVAAKYDAKEVKLVKKKIKDIESKRVDLLFSSIDQANIILGRQAPVSEHIIRNFSNFADSHRERAF